MPASKLTDWVNAFDMRTSVVIYLLIVIIATYALTLTWIHNKRRFPGLEYFVLYFASLSLGISLTLFKGILPELVTVVLANGLMFSGNIMLLWGMARFLGTDLNRSPYLILGLVFVCSYTWFTFFRPDIRIRIMLFSAMALPSLVHGTYLIFFKADPNHRRYALDTGITMVFFSLVYLSRFYHAYAGSAPDTYFNTPIPDTAHHMMGVGLTVFLTLCLHLMINRKLLHQTKSHARTLEELASRDKLTSLYNRRKMESLLEKEFSRFKRYGCPFSLILCDIDHFKKTNDTQGHDAGDRVLASVASLMKQNIRAQDTAGRWGGEEFLIILPASSEQQGAETAEKLRTTISRATDKAAFGRVTLSFGVAEANAAIELHQILKHADQALYRAKNSGRNRVFTHTSQ